MVCEKDGHMTSARGDVRLVTAGRGGEDQCDGSMRTLASLSFDAFAKDSLEVGHARRFGADGRVELAEGEGLPENFNQGAAWLEAHIWGRVVRLQSCHSL